MANASLDTRLRSPAASVDLHATRLHAGTLLEQGDAFVQLEAAAWQSSRAGQRGLAEPVSTGAERFDVVVIGGGQAGLSVGYHLARRRLKFVILEAGGRIGDSWRRRWDSLRLFTPARYDGLDGMPFPARRDSFPTKDEMADYLEQYAQAFALPVRTGVQVEEVTRVDDSYHLRTGAGRYVADHVVVAAASYQKPRIPGFAAGLEPRIRQFHSSDYRGPSQLAPGAVLLVGAGNSGAELALELSRSHRVWLAGRHPGHLPVRHDGAFAYHFVVPIVFRLVFHRLLSADTPMGRKARPHFVSHSGPLIRVKPSHLEQAGVQRVSRLAGVQDGRPLLDNGQVLDVDNVIWCTGFQPGLDWIKLPVFDATGRPRQYRGVAADEPGLYFAGLAFLHSASSSMIHGVGRDAERIAQEIARRVRAAASRVSRA